MGTFLCILAGCENKQTKTVNTANDFDTAVSVDAANNGEELPKTVKAQIIQQRWVDSTLNYLGVVKAKDTKNYSFQLGGNIEKMYIKEGDHIKAGMPIAKLDTKTLEYSDEISSNNKTSANAAAKKQKKDMTVK